MLSTHGRAAGYQCLSIRSTTDLWEYFMLNDKKSFISESVCGRLLVCALFNLGTMHHYGIVVLLVHDGGECLVHMAGLQVTNAWASVTADLWEYFMLDDKKSFISESVPGRLLSPSGCLGWCRARQKSTNAQAFVAGYTWSLCMQSLGGALSKNKFKSSCTSCWEIIANCVANTQNTMANQV